MHQPIPQFVPREDEFVSSWYTERFSWYTLENFRAALGERFHIRETFASCPTPRVLLHCERLET